MAVMAAAGAAVVLAGGVMPTAAAAVTGVPCKTPALVSALSGAASGTTLSLAKGCTYVLTSALPAVAEDLTINGNGATLHRSTAAGTAAFTILTITAGTVTLNRLSFTNGNGAITVNNLAKLIVTGGVFSGNTAANGGAISNTASTVVQVNGASFINNTATRDGGAMYVFTALGDQITDCRFLGNTAAGSGGAYWEWSNGTTISRSTFGGNKATTGGALYLDDQGSLITTTAIPAASITARIRHRNTHPCRLLTALFREIRPEAAEAAFTTRDPSARREPRSSVTEPSAGAAASTTTAPKQP